MSKEYFAKLLFNHVAHNFAFTLAIFCCFAVIVWGYGCESSCLSIKNEGLSITRDELDFEVNTFLELAEIRYKQLNRQDELKAEVFRHALLFAETGTLNPLGVIMSLAGIVGVGAVADNVTKRRREGKALTSYVEKVKADNVEKLT